MFYGYSQTRKEYWAGSNKMADLASKCLLLYIRNVMSYPFIYRSVELTGNVSHGDSVTTRNSKKMF